MFIEIHCIQNFAPSNLNRDDTGSPKDCEFGGHRRARVSSQCWKRAVREYFQDQKLFEQAQLAVRTKKLVSRLGSLLQKDRNDRTEEQARAVAELAVSALGVKLDTKSKEAKKTSVLLFLGNDQVEKLASICDKNWDELAGLPKKGEDKISKNVAAEFKDALQASKAVDLALFGRMIAEDPTQNVDAACQVAHALSTHRVAPEFDYYTAVDDLGDDEDGSGAGMLGTQEFNSACFYRYANVNFEQLVGNLQDDVELAKVGVRAFLESFIMAIPKAKQNGSAAQSLPSFVMTVVRDKGLASLANAFVKPVDGRNNGLVVNSVEALAGYWGKIDAVYGSNGLKSPAYTTVEDAKLDGLGAVRKVENVADLVTKTMDILGGDE
jgi:CRISPR system Cascade subunit CasC